jgi:hypothetical protein
MVKKMLSLFICKLRGHNFVDAGSCPFTGKAYNACTKCESMVAV